MAGGMLILLFLWELVLPAQGCAVLTHAWYRLFHPLHTPLLSQIPVLQPSGIFLGAVDRDNVCWGPADGDKSLLPTSPRPFGSAGNLGDSWLDFFIPDGWEVLARMENNLSGVGILLAGAFWIKQSLCREVAEPQWPLQGPGAEFWLRDNK